MGSVAVVSYITGLFGMGNFVVFLFGVYALYHFVLARVISAFQTNTWPRVQEWYKRRLTWLLKGYRPIGVVVFMIVLWCGSIYDCIVFRIDSIFYFARSKSWIFSAKRS